MTSARRDFNDYCPVGTGLCSFRKELGAAEILKQTRVHTGWARTERLGEETWREFAMGSKKRERMKLWNGSVSRSEEERNFKTTHTKDVGQFLLLLVEIQVLSPCACVEEFYVTLRHARHATKLTPRHAMLRHCAPLCNWSRRATLRLATYVTVRPAPPRDETPCRTTPRHLLHANHPNPRHYVLPTEWISVICTGLRKIKQRLFSGSAFTVLSIVY